MHQYNEGISPVLWHLTILKHILTTSIPLHLSIHLTTHMKLISRTFPTNFLTPLLLYLCICPLYISVYYFTPYLCYPSQFHASLIQNASSMPPLYHLFSQVCHHLHSSCVTLSSPLSLFPDFCPTYISLIYSSDLYLLYQAIIFTKALLSVLCLTSVTSSL